MNIDRASVDRILALDDATLKKLAKEIADAAGADRRKANAFIENVGGLRAAVGRLSEKELQAIVDGVGEEKSGEIARLLRERGIDVGQRFFG